MSLRKKLKMIAFVSGALGIVAPAFAAELKVGDPAPRFELKTDEGKPFRLEDRKGSWTVLYFYPKADTPGCTKQACTYRDSIEKIRKIGAEVYGVSADDVDAIRKFRSKYHLNFTLLADPEGKAIAAYGTKMPIVKMSKRWTFIVDPALVIRSIDAGVDPVKDAGHVAARISELQASTPKSK